MDQMIRPDGVPPLLRHLLVNLLSLPHHAFFGETPDHRRIGDQVLGWNKGEQAKGLREVRAADVGGDHCVPGGGVSVGHLVEQVACPEEKAVVGVGSEERGPGDDVPKGHAIEDGLSSVEVAVAAALGDLGVAEWEVAAGLGVGGSRSPAQSELGQWTKLMGQ